MKSVFLDKNNSIAEALGIAKGVTAIVGGGGKTTLMLRLAGELSAKGRVIITTTTHIFPPQDVPVLLRPDEDKIRAALAEHNAICAGNMEHSTGKLTAADIPVKRLAELADYVIIEADGAKRLPLKAPACHEPVIPNEAELVIAVAGLDGIGKAIGSTVFRPELYGRIIEKSIDETITPRDAARVIQSPGGQRKGVMGSMRFAAVLNKADDDGRIAAGKSIADELDPSLVERVIITRLKGE